MLSAATCYHIMATAIPIVPASAAHLEAFMPPHPPKHVATNTKHPPAQPPPHNNLAKFWMQPPPLLLEGSKLSVGVARLLLRGVWKDDAEAPVLHGFEMVLCGVV